MANRPLQILLVDDDVSWQRIYKYYLENENISVETATNKHDALTIMDQKEFDIAVIDLRLVADDDTNFEGLDVARYMRQVNPKTRIVIKSGFLDDAKVRLGLEELKVDRVFDKGKPIEEFVNGVLNIIRPTDKPEAKENHEQ